MYLVYCQFIESTIIYILQKKMVLKFNFTNQFVCILSVFRVLQNNNISVFIAIITI